MNHLVFTDSLEQDHLKIEPSTSDLIEAINLLSKQLSSLLIKTNTGVLIIYWCKNGRYYVHFSGHSPPQWGRIFAPQFADSIRQVPYFDPNGEKMYVNIRNTITRESTISLCTYFLETARFPKGTLWEGGDMNEFIN